MKQVVSSQDKGWRQRLEEVGERGLGQIPTQEVAGRFKKQEREREKAAKVIDQLSGNKNSL